MKTARAEQRTPKMPFSAQYHGVSPAAMDLVMRIPVGKNNPMSSPIGKITATEATILSRMGAVIMVARRALSKNLRPMRHPAVRIGYKYTHGARVKGRRSLTRLPIPVLAIRVNRRIPRAYKG